MDDANAPSLLSLPYFGCCAADDAAYLSTRAFVLSEDNPYFFRGARGRRGRRATRRAEHDLVAGNYHAGTNEPRRAGDSVLLQDVEDDARGNRLHARIV